MNSIPPTPDKRNQKPPPTWRTRLHRRGLSDTTINALGIQPDGCGWAYPVRPDHGSERWKAFDSDHNPKYRWLPRKPDGLEVYDPDGHLADYIAGAGGALILVEGEPDVWALWEAGLKNATCLFSSTADLLQLGVTRVTSYPDRDQAGTAHAIKVRDTLTGTGIPVKTCELPYDMGSKADVGQLLLEVGREHLREALDRCGPLDLPGPALTKPPDRERAGFTPPPDIGGLWEQYGAEVDARAKAGLNLGGPNDKGFSKNIRCPFHEDHTPSATYNYHTHSIYCFVCGNHDIHETAERLGVPAWDDYKADHAPAPAPDRRHFSQGVPHRLISLLLNLHGDTWLNPARGALPNLGAAAVTYYVWTSLVLAGNLRDGEPVTAKGLSRASQTAGLKLSKDTAKRGLSQLVEWEIGEFLSLPVESSRVGTKSRLIQQRRGPKGRQFVAKPLGEAIPAFLKKLEPHLLSCVLVKEFPDLPVSAETLADRLAEFDLTGEHVAAIDRQCSPLYEAHHELRNKAQREYERRRGIFWARYGPDSLSTADPLVLPEGAPTPNAAQFRNVIDEADLDAKGGVRTDRHVAARKVGRTLSAHKASCDRRDIVSIPQYEEFPLDLTGGEVVPALEAIDARAFERGTMEIVAPDGHTVRASARQAATFDYEGWMARHEGGQPPAVRVRRASIEKRKAQATDADIKAHRQEGARQQAFSRRRKRKPKPRPTPAPEPPQQWPEAYVLRQGDVRKHLFGVGDLADGRFVTAQGGPLARQAAVLWRCFADVVGPPL